MHIEHYYTQRTVLMKGTPTQKNTLQSIKGKPIPCILLIIANLHDMGGGGITCHHIFCVRLVFISNTLAQLARDGEVLNMSQYLNF